VKRGENPGLNMTTMLVMTIDRLTSKPEAAPQPVHLLREDFSHACGQDDRGHSSGVLAEVTCTACKAVAGA
jgi:hypothetical protein